MLKSLGLERIRGDVSEFYRNNFMVTNRLHVVIYIVKIAWGVTYIQCFYTTLKKQ